MSDTLHVYEIFHSLQGESSFAGIPCTFVRLAGCNLNCRWCDTVYAATPETGDIMTIRDIIRAVKMKGCALVEITGGEPLMQGNTLVLIDQLIQKGYNVLLETNGSFDITAIHKKCIKIIDIKCPASGENDQMVYSNLYHLNPVDQIKFVISDKTDFDFAVGVVNKYLNHHPYGNILFSPSSWLTHPAVLATWIIDSGIMARFQIQLHKFLWPEIDQGV